MPEAGSGSWLNDTVVILLPPHPLEVTGAARERSAGHHLGAVAARGGQAAATELARVDAYLDDERFIAPWRTLFSARLGRPSVPVDTLLRLLYLKHRYGLGYETPCKE